MVLDALVLVVVLEPVVGRTGALALAVPVAVVVDVGLEVTEVAPGDVGQSVTPHSRSERQQPPPRDAGHARYEDEHESVVCGPV